MVYVEPHQLPSKYNVVVVVIILKATSRFVTGNVNNWQWLSVFQRSSLPLPFWLEEHWTKGCKSFQSVVIFLQSQGQCWITKVWCLEETAGMRFLLYSIRLNSYDLAKKLHSLGDHTVKGSTGPLLHKTKAHFPMFNSSVSHFKEWMHQKIKIEGGFFLMNYIILTSALLVWLSWVQWHSISLMIKLRALLDQTKV